MSAALPPGARLLDDWITAAEEERLLGAIDASPWRDDLQRRVQHYGWRYDYRARSVDASMSLGPLPSWADALARRIAAEGHDARAPDQVIVNEYLPGQGSRVTSTASPASARWCCRSPSARAVCWTCTRR